MPTSPRTTRRWGRTATTSRGFDGCGRGHALPPRTKGEGKFGDQIREVLGMYFWYNQPTFSHGLFDVALYLRASCNCILHHQKIASSKCSRCVTCRSSRSFPLALHVQSLQCAHGRTVDSEPSSKLLHARENGTHKIVSLTKRWLPASRTLCGPATTTTRSTGPTTGTGPLDSVTYRYFGAVTSGAYSISDRILQTHSQAQSTNHVWVRLQAGEKQTWGGRGGAANQLQVVVFRIASTGATP